VGLAAGKSPLITREKRASVSPRRRAGASRGGGELCEGEPSSTWSAGGEFLRTLREGVYVYPVRREGLLLWGGRPRRGKPIQRGRGRNMGGLRFGRGRRRKRLFFFCKKTRNPAAADEEGISPFQGKERSDFVGEVCLYMHGGGEGIWFATKTRPSPRARRPMVSWEQEKSYHLYRGDPSFLERCRDTARRKS